MPLQSGTGRRRRVTASTASAGYRTSSAAQQSPSPRVSAIDFIVSSSSSDGNASTPPNHSSSDCTTGRPRRTPTKVAAREPPPTVVEDTYYWPTVRRHIDNRGNGASGCRIRVKCSICYDDLPVRGLEPSNELLQHEGGVVLSCGHIFCRECLAESFYGQSGKKLTRTCPMCREEMECQQCGDLGRCVAIPKDHDDVGEFPLTVPEGGEKASICLRCEARKVWIWKVEHGQHGQHGQPSRNVIETDFERLVYHMMDCMEDDGAAMGMAEMEQQLLVLFKENFMRLLEAREQYISQYTHDVLLKSTSYPWM